MKNMNHLNKKYDMALISKNRKTIFGLTILWIAMFHSIWTIENNSAAATVLKMIKAHGNLGVDIFLFVSGISLFFSIQTTGSIGSFYKKRLQRIEIPTLIVCIPFFFAVDIAAANAGWTKFLLDLSGISLFTNGTRTIWFTTAILICYAMYPFIYRIFKKTNWSVIPFIGISALLLAFNYGLSIYCPNRWNYVEIMFRRFFIFIVGAYFGKFVFEKKHIGLSYIQIAIISVVLFSALVILENRFFQGTVVFQRYAYILLAIPFTFLFSILGENRSVRKCVSWLAPYTLEFYLLQEKIIYFLKPVMADKHLLNLTAFAGAVALAFAVKKIEKLLIR